MILESPPRKAEGTLLSQQRAQRRDEAVGILLVVVDVRADAQAAQAWRDVNVLRRQLLGERIGSAVAEAEAQDMRRPHARLGDDHTRIA